MTHQAIPSLLRNALHKQQSQKQKRRPLVVEVDSHVVSISLLRSQELSQQKLPSKKKRPTSVASQPTLLLLLSQERLEILLADKNNPLCKHIVCLSEHQSPKADLRRLSSHSRILATTPQRAIDHIRRDNIFLSSTQALVVAYDFLQDKEEDDILFLTRQKAFLDDCRFIFTKLRNDTIIELFVSSEDHLPRRIDELADNMLLLAKQTWERPLYPLRVIPVPSLTNKVVEETLYALHSDPYLLIGNKENQWEIDPKVYPRITSRSIGFAHLESLQVPQVSTVVCIDLDEESLVSVIRQINEWEHPITQIVALIRESEAHTITTSKENLLMNNTTKPLYESDEVLSGKIQMLVAKLNIDENPEEIEELKKIIRRNVPFYRRGHFSAYLLRELLGSPVKKTPQQQQKVARPSSPAPKKGARNIPEDAKTLYLNIGNMRKLYAKELSQIFQQQLEITAKDIYSIRIHPKFSFVTLSPENAEKAIEKMQGLEIRGRTLSVSYSHNK